MSNNQNTLIFLLIKLIILLIITNLDNFIEKKLDLIS